MFQPVEVDVAVADVREGRRDAIESVSQFLSARLATREHDAEAILKWIMRRDETDARNDVDRQRLRRLRGEIATLRSLGEGVRALLG